MAVRPQTTQDSLNEPVRARGICVLADCECNHFENLATIRPPLFIAGGPVEERRIEVSLEMGEAAVAADPSA
jgi:hypothetical protein